MTTEQKTCPFCSTQFTWTSAAPRQRFCSAPCKHYWWNRRRRQATAALRGSGTPPPASQPCGTGPHAATHDARGGDHGPGALAATPACPHCRQPVAIVAWLVPPAAASVATPPQATPPRHADTVRDNQ